MRFSIITTFTLVATAIATPYTLMERGSVALQVHSDTGTSNITVQTKNRPLVGTMVIADALKDIIKTVNESIRDKVTKDNEKRQEFTKRVVAEMRAQFPKFSVVASNVGYRFDGAIKHKSTVACDIKVGTKVTFDVLVWETGRFELKGDGGFQNWAYIINDTCKANRGLLTC